MSCSSIVFHCSHCCGPVLGKCHYLCTSIKHAFFQVFSLASIPDVCVSSTVRVCVCMHNAAHSTLQTSSLLNTWSNSCTVRSLITHSNRLHRWIVCVYWHGSLENTHKASDPCVCVVNDSLLLCTKPCDLCLSPCFSMIMDVDLLLDIDILPCSQRLVTVTLVPRPLLNFWNTWSKKTPRNKTMDTVKATE